MQGTGYLVLVTSLGASTAAALGGTGRLRALAAPGSYTGVSAVALSSDGTLGVQGHTIVPFRRPRLVVYTVEASPVPVLKGWGGPT